MFGGCPYSYIIISKTILYTKIHSDANIIFELFSHWCVIIVITVVQIPM